MIRWRMFLTAILGAACLFAAAPAHAQTAPAQTQQAPYDSKMLRLGEVIGALHFLRNLCGEKGNDWRNQMEKLLEAEKPETERRKRFVASFNRGYRSFASIHTTCTPTSMEAIRLYMIEGQALSREIVVRYGG